MGNKPGSGPASGGGSSPVPLDRNIAVGVSDEEVDRYFQESPVFNVSGCIDL